jgi:hypothetical protein
MPAMNALAFCLIALASAGGGISLVWDSPYPLAAALGAAMTWIMLVSLEWLADSFAGWLHKRRVVPPATSSQTASHAL